MPDDDGEPLELDPSWVAERAARQTAYTPPTPAKPPRRTAALVVALLLIAVVGLGFAVILQDDKTKAPPPSKLPGVSIYIRAAAGVDVTIDGVFVGTTPLVFTSPKSTRPILVEARQIGTARQVTPLFDQTVFLHADGKVTVAPIER